MYIYKKKIRENFSFIADSSEYFCFNFQQKKLVQKTKSLQQSQTGFEQMLQMSLDLSSEEEDEWKKLRARYGSIWLKTTKYNISVTVIREFKKPRWPLRG